MQFSYKKIKKIGEGAYATIFYASRHKSTEDDKFIKSTENNCLDHVAIKRIKRNTNAVGIDISAVREIKHLKLLSKIKEESLAKLDTDGMDDERINILKSLHPSALVLSLLEVFTHNGSIHLVLEYCPFSLESLINSNILFTAGDIKLITFMILKGVYFLHSNYIIHRDLKPGNILIYRDGTIRLADFGLSRNINKMMSPSSITRWYRPPEMLLCKYDYDTSVDIWIVGCIFGEMLLRVPLFAGGTDVAQLDLIFKAIGTPDQKYAENMNMIKFNHYEGSPLFDTISDIAARDLVRNMLKYDNRFDAMDCINHEYFSKGMSKLGRMKEIIEQMKSK